MDSGFRFWLQTRRKKLALIFVIGLFLLAVYWLFTHSRISIQVSGGPSGEEINYTLRNTASGEAEQVKSTEKTISMWVGRGSYEVSASSASGNFIEFIPSTPLFFETKNIVGELQLEKTRVFVGDGVKACAGLAGSTLVSGGCGGVYGELAIHKPATKTTPTYIVNNPDRSIFGKNQALISTGELATQIIKAPQVFKEGVEDNPNSPSAYTAISFTDRSTKSKKIELGELSGTTQFYFKDIGSGNFIAYQESPDKLYEFNTSGNKTGEASMKKPDTQNVNLMNIHYKNGNEYAALYSSSADTYSTEAVSEVIVTKNSNTNTFIFDKISYSDLRLCGVNKLCLAGGNTGMDVYDISGDKAKRDFSVSRVSSIAGLANGTQVLAINDIGVLNIDVDSRKGFMEYSFGDYSFNEINMHRSGYVLRLTDPKDRVVGLYVDQTSTDADSIDKKRLEIQSMPEVSLVSVNRNFIYIVANLGDPVYIKELKIFGDNEETRRKAADSINAEIDRLGIDRSKYTITSNAF